MNNIIAIGLVWLLTVVGMQWALSSAYINHGGRSTPVVSYEKDVKPIFRKHCISCHQGAMSYEIAYKQRQKIYDKFVKQGEMPPKHRSQPTELEVDIVRKWIETGARK